MDTESMERTESYEYGAFSVDVASIGPQAQPWGGLECYGYRVSISMDAKPVFETKFYGSNVDYLAGRRGFEEAAKCVLGELLDAQNDPDEFYEMATGDDESGHESRFERAKGVMALIEAAESVASDLEDLAQTGFFEDR